MSNREDKLWRLIKFDKTATPGQITAWCRELGIAVANKSKEKILNEMLQELDLIHQRADIIETYIHLLLAKEKK